ncbi:UDP-N-acetylmuramoyl-tripeptide--D-alanyl-D-alanine ligase [Falsiroseomonas selenitidurans]|uniref:UDP-N-acetylmuramoyl-tripeptide--D-alanyl-D-alanine ligase n=1 Tax=Falsiroseomonas selenitidurans TaxID=2716335 RepID=A0ABX1E4V0_9PROT|nr:UDP-N-acetylmuramoyl-tripeptide--D-alanyl-D-alanine ligase [Falsiroseomonas selenitidurans]NKC32199.1 UDP-N-acetylmuramoyl-tripeptide--D-alanyl-D-alanine ligase [Falsiroseomonas selenitidurans]
MTALWDSAGLRAATGGMLAAEVAVRGVSIDSRAVAPGDLFVALRDARDGHDFAADALARGAAAALVDHVPPGVAPEAPLLRVGDTLEGLRALGAAGRARSGARVVGVTGSVGKTTTKEMLRALLGRFGPTHAAVASYNNHWGVPLTLARMPAASRFAVIEIGMNHPGEIAPLAALAAPHVAVITAVAAAHLGHMGSLEAIAREKAAILSGLRHGEPAGSAVLPAESPFLPLLRQEAGAARVLTFGEGGDVHAVSIAPDAEGSDVVAEVAGTRLAFRLGTPGLHMAGNALAALAAVAALGLDVAQAAPALAGFRALAGRGDRRAIATPDGGTATLLDEAYNGQPPSMRAALALLRLLPARRRVVVLGQMGELGEFAAAEHAALAPHVAASADLVFACGTQMRAMLAALPAGHPVAWTETSAELAPLAAAALRDGDAVLVKGSLATGMKTVVQALCESLPR